MSQLHCKLFGWQGKRRKRIEIKRVQKGGKRKKRAKEKSRC